MKVRGGKVAGGGWRERVWVGRFAEKIEKLYGLFFPTRDFSLSQSGYSLLHVLMLMILRRLRLLFVLSCWPLLLLFERSTVSRASISTKRNATGCSTGTILVTPSGSGLEPIVLTFVN